ncbi:MAG: hypothetical protein ACI82Z_000916 [Cellvibrionaceae bacterium]|jgi:hypothetical protein
MQKIYTAQTLLDVTDIKNFLEAARIPCELRNEYAAGGIGELSFIDAWPELWVNNEDVRTAQQLIDSRETIAGHEWRCPCGEMNGQNFLSCWACQRDKPSF